MEALRLKLELRLARGLRIDLQDIAVPRVELEICALAFFRALQGTTRPQPTAPGIVSPEPPPVHVATPGLRSDGPVWIGMLSAPGKANMSTMRVA